MAATLTSVAAVARPASAGQTFAPRRLSSSSVAASLQHRLHTQYAVQCRRAVVVAAGGGAAPAVEHLQLATARLPADVNKAAFNEAMYQWATTLVQNGRNLPFALPLKCDRIDDGFQISLLRVVGGNVVSVADLRATVEAVAGTGDVLMVRFFEGAGAVSAGMGGAAGNPPAQRLETLLSSLVDVPTIMNTMPQAIKRSVMVSR